MPQTEIVFVLEQTLGHGTHARNLERAAARTPDVGARFVLINHALLATGRQVPVLSNHSVRTAWSARTGVRPLLRSRPADALFIHTQVGALLLGDVMRRIPTVVSMDATPLGYDSIGEHYQHQPQAPALERLKTDINQRSYARAAALTTWSDWAAGSLVDDYGMPPEKITVVSPGADVSRFRPAADPRRRPGPLRVLFVGGDFHRKGGNDLFAAVRQLPGQVEVDIVTAADPGSAPPGVRVHTGVTHESPLLLELFQGADVFVLPSRAECFGIVYAEAMACGLPVIGCPVGAVAELVVDGHNGLLVPAGQPAALADALQRLAQRPEERLAMGERGLALARRKHDAQRNVEQLIELTQRIARRTTVASVRDGHDVASRGGSHQPATVETGAQAGKLHVVTEPVAHERVAARDEAGPKAAAKTLRRGLALISGRLGVHVHGEGR
jgi:glycosyltransferase involved in cell wall biosynthesis